MTNQKQTSEIARFAREAIAGAPPFENMTLDVDENGIYSTISGDKSWWRVPVIPQP